MLVRSNIAAMNTYLDYKKTDSLLNKSMARLSSGLKSPTPNAGSEWVVGNDMQALQNEYDITVEHINGAKGILEIAQTALMEVADMVLRMDELAHRSASDEINSDQRIEMSAEFSLLRTNIASTFAEVRYNDITLWDVNDGIQFSIHVGRSNYINVSTYNVSNQALGMSTVRWSGGTMASAKIAAGLMSTTIREVNTIMARMGAQIRQLEAKATIFDETATQQAALKAQITEVDFAKEMKTFTSMQVLIQSANAMVAQSNMKTQMVLQLFGG